MSANMTRRTLILALATSLAVAAPVAAAGAGAAERGRALFVRCAGCHTDGPVRGVAPSLRTVFGRRAAAMDGYRYSAALGRADFAWSAQGLDAFLTDPQAVAPGTTMPTRMPNPRERADLIAYLASLR